MPRPTMPLTPAASTDIAGKDNAPLSASDQSFNLPPPALQSSRRGSGGNMQSSSTAATNHHRPIQPAGSPQYSLPPPPTRSRTIIQMNPKQQPQSPETTKASTQPSNGRATGKRARGDAGSGTSAPKKQASSTSAAGKKIARKTAHSVIERRRRSKMNEEFATLKNMIPACSGQDMHKLAILQASIDYLRYLESCIHDLKAANTALSTPLIRAQAPPLRQNDGTTDDIDDDEEDEEERQDEDGVEPMEDVQLDSAHSYTSSHSLTQSPTTGQLASQQSRHHYRHSQQQQQQQHPRSVQSEPTSARASVSSSSLSTLPSPAFGPQHISGRHNSLNSNENLHLSRSNETSVSTSLRPDSQHSSVSTAITTSSASTSPTILPSNKEQDEEASAALLMLNKDRRYSKESLTAYKQASRSPESPQAQRHDPEHAMRLDSSAQGTKANGETDRRKHRHGTGGVGNSKKGLSVSDLLTH